MPRPSPGLFGILLAVAAPALADPTGLEVMELATQSHRAMDERAVTEMVIVAEGQRTKKRSALFLTASSEDRDDKLLIRFESPADIRGTALLTLERGESEDQHIYLPALKKTKRVARSGKSNRFAGTDFTYEDLRSEELTRSAYALLRSEDVEGHPAWVVEATPNSDWWKEESAYGRRLFWIRKDHHLILRVEYFDRRDRMVKVRKNHGWKQIQGLWRFYGAEMQDLVRGTKTLLRIKEREINPGLSAALFTPAALTRQ